MKKDKLKKMIDAIGNGTREAYLEQYPHGYKATKKIHKNLKKYSRKKLKKF